MKELLHIGDLLIGDEADVPHGTGVGKTDPQVIQLDRCPPFGAAGIDQRIEIKIESPAVFRVPEFGEIDPDDMEFSVCFERKLLFAPAAPVMVQPHSETDSGPGDFRRNPRAQPDFKYSEVAAVIGGEHLVAGTQIRLPAAVLFPVCGEF